MCSALLVRKLSKQLEVQALVRIHDGNLFYSWLIYVGNVRREGKKHKNDKKEAHSIIQVVIAFSDVVAPKRAVCLKRSVRFTSS